MRNLNETVDDKLQRLTKWRAVFAGWQLGTRPKEDPECQAVRDHREVTLLLRAEVSALAAVLIRKGVFTAEEFTDALGEEADALNEAIARKFPGITASLEGTHYKMPEAAETMKGWRP